MREFITAIVEQEEGDEERPVEFALDGRELRAYKPTESQFALLMVAMSRYASDREQAAGVIEFFLNLLDDSSREYIVNRMFSREDPLPIETMIDMTEFLVEEWGGRPFQRSSDSTPSRSNGGRKSTPRTQRSTSSRSHPIAS